MNDTASKLSKILETKAAIKQAIIDKGVEVPDGTTFDEYPNKIAAIEAGGSGPDYTAVYLAKTSNETTYKELFKNSTATELDLSGYNTSNVTNMNNMFLNCESLTSLDLSSFDTSNVINMDNMFFYCKSLTSLDLSHFDTSNVTDMGGMFGWCSNLTSLDLSGWDTSNVTDMSSMFQGTSLTSLDLSHFDTSNVTDMTQMFYASTKIESLDLSNFDMTKVEKNNLFLSSCVKLHTLRLDNCSNDTINKIITSSSFPTGLVDPYGDKITRKLYCKQANAEGLTLPDGWEFVYVD